MTTRDVGPPEMEVAAPTTEAATHHNHQVDTPNGTARCTTRGCRWRGVCPVHSARYPAGFGATSTLMRGPGVSRTAVRVVA